VASRTEGNRGSGGGIVRIAGNIITAYEPPRRLASSTRLAAMDIHGTLDFDPVPGGTRMRWASDVRPHGLLRLMTPVTRLHRPTPGAYRLDRAQARAREPRPDAFEHRLTGRRDGAPRYRAAAAFRENRFSDPRPDRFRVVPGG
jgi:hypothetical protein